MKRLFQANAKSLALSIMTITLLAAGQSVTHAQLQIMGNATGNLVTPPGLTYNGSTINGTTSGGTLPLDNAPTPPNNLNNLGSFTLSGNPGEFAGSFTLFATITRPSGIFGGNTRTYNATVFTFDGGLLVDIDNTPQAFPFSGDQGTGIFTLTVDDLAFFFGSPRPGLFRDAVSPLQTNTVNCPQFPCTGALTGRIGPAVPEPATMILLATGLGGVVASVRRRKRQPTTE